MAANVAMHGMEFLTVQAENDDEPYCCKRFVARGAGGIKKIRTRLRRRLRRGRRSVVLQTANLEPRTSNLVFLPCGGFS